MTVLVLSRTVPTTGQGEKGLGIQYPWTPEEQALIDGINEPAARRKKLLVWEWGSPGMSNSIGMETLQNPRAGKAAEPPPSPNQNTNNVFKKEHRRCNEIAICGLKSPAQLMPKEFPGLV